MRLRVVLLFFVIAAKFIFAMDFSEAESEFFKKRRQALMDKAGNGVIVLAAPLIKKRNSDIDYKFRQSSNIYYLTGLEMSDMTLVLIPGDPEPFRIFAPPSSQVREMWMGPSPGKKELMGKYGADEVYHIKDFQKEMRRIMRKSKTLYVDFSNKEFMKQLSEKFPSVKYLGEVKNIASVINDMRLIKDALEIKMLEKSIGITGKAVIESMKRAQPGLYEYQIGAVVNYVYRNGGCSRKGFPSIIASGPNAQYLHYEHNNRKMKNGDILLMDIGAEYGYYSGDISRTFPVNGKFTKSQKEIYNIVLDSQKKGLAEIKPGKGFKEVMKATLNELADGLFRVGLITDKSKYWQIRVWAKFFQFSHWLGLDTHDVGGYDHRSKTGKVFKPGMVLTLEPGLYIGEGGIEKAVAMYRGRVPDGEIKAFIEKVKPAYNKYKNISVRIEDDILVTETGNRNLSDFVPKEVRAIEKLMKKKSFFR